MAQERLAHSVEQLDAAVEAIGEHNADKVRHITSEERAKWNAKPNAEALAAVSEQSAINRTTLGTQTINLIANNTPSRTVSGVTVTPNADGSITLNGTATAAGFIAYNMQSGATTYSTQFDGQKHIPTGKYIMSGGTAYAQLQFVRSAEEGKEGTIVSCSGSEVTIDITDDDLYTWCRLRIVSGSVFDNETIYPMIRPAEVSDGTYRQYQAPLQKQIDDLTARVAALEAAAATEEVT